MSASFDTIDERAERDAARERAFELHSVVVEHDGMPDRCTVYPKEATRSQRTTRWISADADCFVALEDAR